MDNGCVWLVVIAVLVLIALAIILGPDVPLPDFSQIWR